MIDILEKQEKLELLETKEDIMLELIKRLDTWLKTNRREYYDKLLPGALPQDFKRLESTIGVTMPESFKQLYRWRNGQPRTCFTAFQFNRSLMNLDAIITDWQVIEGVKEEFKDESWWNSKWIPFLDNGGGDHICIDMNDSKPGRLITYWRDWDDRSINYPSLEKWLEIFVDSLENNMWEDLDGDFHPSNDARWEAFLKETIPGYPIKYSSGKE